MFNPHIYQNSRLPGSAYMEIVRQPDGEPRRGRLSAMYMPLRLTRLTGNAQPPIARLQVRHEFGHPEAEAGAVLEAVYRFPLPGDAAVTGVHVSFGETTITAELADRTDAEREYDSARATGHQAVLVSRESPDVFSMHISGIEPGQNVLIVTDFVVALRPAGRGFSLRLPLTPAPRYSSPGARGSRREHGQPLAVSTDPGHRFAMELLIPDDSDVSSRTHNIDLQHDVEGLVARLKEGSVVPDRDLVLEITPAAGQHGASLRLQRYADDHEYFLALVVPPEKLPGEQVPPREIILLVDRSGSMSGAKWEAADWAVHKFLAELRPEDSFGIGLFHDHTQWFSRATVPATTENIQLAHDFVDGHQDSGGTRLELALEEALACGRASGEHARHVVIVTDAQVTDAGSILALARAELASSERRRISALCIDAAPNSHLVNELVTIGGGIASFLTSDPDHGDMSTALDEVMSFWGQPAAAGLSLEINRSDVWVMGRPVEDQESRIGERGRVDLGDLPAGRPLWVVGRAARSSEPLQAMLRGRNSGEIASATASEIADEAIRYLFGAARINALEYQLAPSHFRSRDQRSRAGQANLRDLLVRESLDYGLVCSETSFVAVRREAGKLVQRGAIVPNAMPAGWEGFAAYRMDDPPDTSAVLNSLLAAKDAYPPKSSSFRAYYAPSAEESQYRAARTDWPAYERPDNRITLFKGVPEISDEETVLYEQDEPSITGHLRALRLRVEKSDDLFDGELLLYIGDDPEPRASMWLRDILNQGGVRPLNIRIWPGRVIRLVLRNVTAPEAIPHMEVALMSD